MFDVGFLYSIDILFPAARVVALYSLNIENCSITSRTIQKVADALGAESIVAQLCIGTLPDGLIAISILLFVAYKVLQVSHLFDRKQPPCNRQCYH